MIRGEPGTSFPAPFLYFRMPNSLRVKVLFFASYADLLGRDEWESRFPIASRVSDVVHRVRSELPKGDLMPERPLVAQNQEHVRLDAMVHDGDEIAFLPPLAGG